MTASLQSFMDGLIDYAGLFPPARLGMREAVDTYARHLDSEHRRMLASFICPVGRLDELNSFRRELERHAPLRITVLGTSPRETDDLLEMAELDADLITAFEAAGWARVEQLEVRWPLKSTKPELLRRYAARLRRSGCSFHNLFFEIDRRETWRNDVIDMTSALERAGDGFGFKIRTGGLTSDLYPPPQQVALAIAACRDAGVPFKATAGLHHPVRVQENAAGIAQHGFFNVFGAAVLAHSAGLTESELLSVVNDGAIENFRFGPDAFEWRDYSASLAQLRAARTQIAISFGSCSFSEPLEDLEQAGLL